LDLRSAFISLAPEHAGRGVTLSSMLLAAPVFLVGRPGAGVLLFAASFVTAVALLERRASATPPLRDVSYDPASPSRPLVRTGQAQGRWELAERDGSRSLVMRWR